MRSLSSMLVPLALVVLSATPAWSICYFPDGSTSNDVPCSDDAAHSACCGNGFVCMSNGMCRGGLRSDGTRDYGRGSCTDKTWRNSKCPSFCIDPDHNPVDNGVPMSRCDGDAERYFCINGQETNCENGTNIMTFPQSLAVLTTIGVEPTSTAPTSSSTSTLSSAKIDASTTSTSLSTSTSGRQNESQTQNNPPSETNGVRKDEEGKETSKSGSGTQIGIGVGIAVGVLVIAAIVAAFLFFRRKKRRNSQSAIQPQDFVRGNMAEAKTFPQTPVYEAPAYDYQMRERHEIG